MSVSIHNWTKQFGRIYGYFEGHTPILVVSDSKIINEIFTKKNFLKFHSRRQFPLEDRRTGTGVHLFSATGDEWRRQRAIFNPTFSLTKIKNMLPTIEDCTATLLNKLQESMQTSPEGFDIYKLYKCLTMDLIWRCCFNMKTDMQNNLNNPYLIRSQQVFARQNSTYLATLLSIFIPEQQSTWLAMHCWLNSIKAILRHLLPIGKNLIEEDPSEWLKNNVDDFIDKAKTSHNENSIKSNDLLRLMLDATKTNLTDINQQSHHDRVLSISEIKQNIYLFMTAGYETASTTLAYITHVLATHPAEQRKLQNHIDSYLNNDDILDLNIIEKMEYLDQFIKETLRMYPITPIIINRECSEQINIPRLGLICPGTKITVDMYSLHYDNELWGPVDTKIFYPERFASKPSHPAEWIPFGIGPRKCVGMKFALTEIKIIIIRLLQKYTVLPMSMNDTDLELVELVTITPKQVSVKLERRTNI
ncbi:unnamed protein product [Adineta steineri]|uniref:Cytochrome P450 n=1 Tax=Adineta steineri TaxID=433720 RepID=A0A818MFF5_9BILA|nr:unnamed protein product [Adineta steineri]CAF3581827.1 unnamed protein product [Adineta steineri]